MFETPAYPWVNQFPSPNTHGRAGVRGVRDVSSFVLHGISKRSDFKSKHAKCQHLKRNHFENRHTDAWSLGRDEMIRQVYLP
jgi:hypothetical protein